MNKKEIKARLEVIIEAIGEKEFVKQMKYFGYKLVLPHKFYNRNISLTEIVTERLINDFGIEKKTINPKSTFTQSFGFDSLDYVEFVMWFESKFQVTLKDERPESIKTFEEFIKYAEEVTK